METWLFARQLADGTSVNNTGKELLDLLESGKIPINLPVFWVGAPVFVPLEYLLNYKYLYVVNGNVRYIESDKRLHNAFINGEIEASTKVWGRRLPAEGLRFGDIMSPGIDFQPDPMSFYSSRDGKPITIISGTNNTGKSLLIKYIRRDIGPNAIFLSSDRFYQLDYLSTATSGDDSRYQRHQSFVSNFSRTRVNNDDSDINMAELLSRLKDFQRDKLWKICKDILGEEFAIRRVDPDNQLSQHYVSVGERSLAVASAGTRLLLVIIAACLDENSSVCIIDEPEIGLNPKVQISLARLFFDSQMRNEHFPHIKQLFIVTHSHFFLDRSDITNNFIATRLKDTVNIRQVASMQDFHDLQINMLGNDLEALFLPSAIIIVEGDSDFMYIKRLFEVFYPSKRISVIRSNGDGDTPSQLRLLNELFVELAKSPYRNRVFILLDRVNSVKTSDYTKYGVPSDNVVILPENGIEYYYPSEILSEIFMCGPNPYSLMRIAGNSIETNGIIRSKKELCREVIGKISITTLIPEELKKRLLLPVQALLM